MAKIPLTSGFSLVPEGTHVFKITEVEYNEAFGKLAVTMETQNGERHIERFTFLKKNGEVNTGAYNAFSFFAKTAMQDFELTEIDHEDLIGCFIECDVEHDTQLSTKNPGKNVTYARLTEKRPSDGWEDTSTTAQLTKTATGKPDLKALLG